MDAEYWDAVEAGDPDTVADATHRLGIRRFDTVGEWPRDRLDELVALRPDLLPEIIRRRGGELVRL